MQTQISVAPKTTAGLLWHNHSPSPLPGSAQWKGPLLEKRASVVEQIAWGPGFRAKSKRKQCIGRYQQSQFMEAE